jgi:hypothetical protein
VTEQERKIAEALEKAAAQYARLNAKQQTFAISEIDRTRLELIDMLTAAAKKDNTISRARLNSLLRDLDEIEAAVRKNGLDAVESAIKESAAFGTQAGEAALVGAIGEGAALGVAFNRMNAEVFRYVTARFADDGLTLSDRVWQLAGDQRDKLNNVIRSGIIRGESVNTMVAAVRKVYDNETWKIRRLVVTEGNTAYRVGVTYRAQRSDVVRGLKVHRGKADRPEHKCTVLSKEDSYGLGTGVFKPTDTEIYSIHPNCTGFLTYVLVDEEER